jgi:hypothetical protein
VPFDIRKFPTVLQFRIMPDRYDIFLSYPSVDRATSHRAESRVGSTWAFSVWMDTERIDDAASIQRSIETDGLARCRVLVAWYSTAFARARGLANGS